jgi:hypothetical protein
VPAPIIDLLGKPGLALLPARLRDDFGIGWTTRDDTAAKVATTAVRAWTSVVPGPPRWMPQARAAYRRVAGASVQFPGAHPP